MKTLIVYKWVIKKDNKYYPIINNGAYFLFNDLDLGFYEIGKIYDKYINPWELIRNNPRRQYNKFHRPGFHFWKQQNNSQLEGYQKCMKRIKNQFINCTLKCRIRLDDIIVENTERVVCERFQILGEIT